MRIHAVLEYFFVDLILLNLVGSDDHQKGANGVFAMLVSTTVPGNCV